MMTRYAKSSSENVDKINNLIKSGFKLYGVQKSFSKEPIMLTFQKEESEEEKE